MKHESPPSHLDVKAFALADSHIAGHDMLSNYERLMHEIQGPGTEIILNWSAQGELRSDATGAAQVWLHLVLDAHLPLTCQRCLGLLDFPVALQQSYRFVADEDLAEAQDDESEEDVLALSRDFNLATLIEDEVLLALPLIPRHQTCPVPVKLALQDPGFEAALDEKRHPFAILTKLQGDKSR